MSMKTALIIPDCHIPYEDKKAYSLMLKAAIDINPDEIVILGDFADFYAVNSHGKHPLLMHTLLEEVEHVKYRLDELDRLFPNAKKVFLEGNHEYRLERYIQNVAPGLFGVTETENILALSGRPNWKFHAYGPNQCHNVLGSFLKARHEPIGNNAKITAQRAMCSLVFGHVHRFEMSHVVGLAGDNHIAFCVGWLGDKRKDKVFGYVKNHAQWDLGFGVVHVDTKTRIFHAQMVNVINNKGEYSCVVNGKRYSSKAA
jgi:UDP-2,3-diacylglucosamine pyrophosphatase LpxH